MSELAVDVNLGGGVLVNYNEKTQYLTIWRNSRDETEDSARIVLDAAMYDALYKYMET